MFYGFWLIMMGILAASTLVISKVPALKDYVARISTYQGWIAIVSAVAGLFTFLPLGFKSLPSLLGIIYLVSAAVMIALGFLLGVATVRPFIKSEQALAKIDAIVLKLAPYQTILGLISIGTGVVATILTV